MPIVTSPGYAHVRLTVTDIERSKAFYSDVFGWTVAIDNSDRADEPGVRESQQDFYGGTVFQTPSGTLFGLRPVAPAGQSFDSEQVGLDHISFMVDSRDVLTAAQEQFENAGIPHGEVTDLTDAGIAILSFSDPDGIHLELTAPLS
ncbi:MAG: VOC family protein [Jatrophihabitans sp.]